MKIHPRWNTLLDSIEAERKTEEQYYLQIINKKSIHEKVADGVAWYPVEVTKKHYTVGEYVEIEVIRNNPEPQNHRIKEGIGVNLFVNLHGEITNYGGTVSLMKGNKMRVILFGDLLDKDDISSKGLIGVEMVYDDRPYTIMKAAVDSLLSSKNTAHAEMRKGLENGMAFDYEKSIDPYQEIGHLNPSQNRAVEGCLRSERFAIIHGPPGTGKTTTIVGLVQKLLQNEKRVLVCAPSNNAVDLLAYRLSLIGLNVTRIGNISRIDDEITHLTVEEKVRGSQEWSQIKKIKIEAEELSKQANKYKRSFGEAERRERYQLRKEGREVRKWARELENRLTNHVIGESQVILSTLIGASHSHLDGLNFETCIIDEASQTLEPECWNAILKSNRVILVGDHKQLPPTVKSPDAIKNRFDTTLLDILQSHIHHSYLLNIQYRMNDVILSFPNAMYYDSKLRSADHIKNQTLRGDSEALIFIDTAGTGFEEEQLPGEFSYFNTGEYFILREHLLSIIERALGESIGIIAPYAEQVRYVRKEVDEDDDLKSLDIKIDSIDGFQGQEKDIIYLSLVRSNDRSQLGFLEDERRLNVALTRAKKKLIIIGDSATLSSHIAYAQLIAHAEKNGVYKSAWEYMG